MFAGGPTGTLSSSSHFSLHYPTTPHLIHLAACRMANLDSASYVFALFSNTVNVEQRVATYFLPCDIRPSASHGHLSDVFVGSLVSGVQPCQMAACKLPVNLPNASCFFKKSQPPKVLPAFPLKVYYLSICHSQDPLLVCLTNWNADKSIQLFSGICTR
ncbi:uncharacterized protein BDR25DRAFT_28692 [Lindgomyces ingoldianus]|uniref:Uncharacterized protein n=1 Tax=Lindgomyces ingoldianus TaxID=673940 RepID=A0ACB6QWM3_9PLEO|nr:uncharacterized protein BDR25DRAFT_28692 [Lindgomyces ingoldianus]KAF2470978.1 hypothetical protein BDR25DRAFT_28692 [Lindgomyces ingoldianus]